MATEETAVNIHIERAVVRVQGNGQDQSPRGPSQYGGNGTRITQLGTNGDLTYDPPKFSQTNPTVFGTFSPVSAIQLNVDRVTCKVIANDGTSYMSDPSIGSYIQGDGTWYCTFTGDQITQLTVDANPVFSLSLLTAYAYRGPARIAPPVTIHVNVLS
jgi:hypothetical protein